ncbi:MAG: hypothetical protein LBS50_08950 [Prevotellaceae bacterium]|nr:hypothetical protein [Prevotellaceae bacterium]
MPWYFYVFGAVAVFSFFTYSNTLTRKWAGYSEKFFTKKLFQTAFIIRLCWVIFSWFFYTAMTGFGLPFEFQAADSFFYHNSAINIVKNGFAFEMQFMSLSDSGYPVYLGLLYKIFNINIFGLNIFIVRVIKSVIGAYTCVLIYRLAKRSFNNENTGRIAGILCMLMPNLIYYCGLHLKEIEMVFLGVFFVERMDNMLRSQKYGVKDMILPFLAAISLFALRTALGSVALLSLGTAVLFANKKVVNWRQRIIVGVWAVVVIAYFIGGQIATEIEETWNARTEAQANSMQFRSLRTGGNEFAKYFSGAAFAPLIFTIPFPTVVETPGQQNIKVINGGNYCKNILSFFAIFAIFMIFKRKEWRKYILAGSYMIGYLGVIALSPFAQSERFHQPALPFVIMFAAYGISLCTNKTKKYYNFWTISLFFAIIGWSFFKLAGRDMV